MPTAFEQQRELVETFRSVARTLLKGPSPIRMRDLDGDLMRSRVHFVMDRLIAVKIIDEDREGSSGNFQWSLVDSVAGEFLERIIADNRRTSQFLWPDEEPPLPTLEEAVESALSAPSPVEEPTTAAPQDTIELIAGVLEGFSARLTTSAERQDQVIARQEQMVGAVTELVSAVAKLSARKQYDDTELLLAIEVQNELLKELHEQGERHKELLENHVQAATGLIKVVDKLNATTNALGPSIDKLVAEGVELAAPILKDTVLRLTAQFKHWVPLMQDCLDGLKAVNENHMSVGDEMNSMHLAVMKGLAALTKGEGGTFTIEAKPVAPVAPYKPRRPLGRNGLPSLSDVYKKKDADKSAANEPLLLREVLPSSIAAKETIEEIETDIAVKEQELAEKVVELVRELPPEDRKQVFDEVIKRAKAQDQKGG